MPPQPPRSLRPARFPVDDLTDESTLRGIGFRHAEFEAAEVNGAEVDHCLFEGTRLPRAIERSVFNGSAFIGCDLANITATESSILESTISGSRMTGTSWINGVIRGSEVESTRLDMVSFRFSALKSVTFTDCDLRQADFQRASLRNVKFEHCDLTGAQFSNVEIHNVRFNRSTLDAIGGTSSLRGATIGKEELMSLAWGMAKELGIKVI